MTIENSPKVIIVDDEKGLRLGTKKLLEREGYSVVTAENGIEGIHLATAEEFDLAIIDLKMPDVDGIKVLKEIRKVFPNTICFIATAFASYDTAIESTKLGAFGYIPKPFSPEEILAHLKRGYEKRLLLVEAEKWRKEREERLLEVAFEKTRLNTIINSLYDGVLVVNISGQAVLFNPSGLRYLNLNNIFVEEFVLDKLHPEITDLINKILETKQYHQVSYSKQIDFYPDRDLFIEVTSSPVPHPNGSLAGVVLVIKDISELKKVEMLKSQFVSMVSHELKAPIAAVYGFLNLILNQNIPLSKEQQTDYIERSQKRLDGLLKLVNDLLDISRMETKTANREIKDINLCETINNVIGILQPEIIKKNISIATNYDPNIPMIKADGEELIRLFTNLISNAIKYNKQAGKIFINLKREDRFLLAEIIDTGIGMKSEEKDKLFKEFFRAKNELTKGISGTGLGLTIVKSIVNNYAGKIEVSSKFKEGTTFKVYLPFS